MTITVYGAGAIGGITGARLAQAGHDVLLVDRAADHVAAMNAGGLTIESRQSAVTIPVRAITPGELGAGLELVLLAVKSQDTPAALEVLAPAPGVRRRDRLAAERPERGAHRVGGRAPSGRSAASSTGRRTGKRRDASCTAATARWCWASSTGARASGCSAWPSSWTSSRPLA